MAARQNETMNGELASIKQAAAVDPSGSNVVLDSITRGLYVGVTGDVVVIFAGDSAAVTLVGLAAGVWHPMQIQQINQTGTTATSIVVGY